MYIDDNNIEQGVACNRFLSALRQRGGEGKVRLERERGGEGRASGRGKKLETARQERLRGPHRPVATQRPENRPPRTAATKPLIHWKREVHG